MTPHFKTVPLKKQIVVFVGLIGFSFLLLSWGSTGHFKINSASGLSFNGEMAQFNAWIGILADHASDADDRKAWDPTEGPKHYIDIDNYPEFVAEGTIPQSMDEAIAAHGISFVYDNGILPWATLTTFDSLKACFVRHDWDKAVLFASDLGHYVADGHMPMHITRNYNGQYTGNTGIHSRYESTMINAYISQFNYAGAEVTEIADVNQYVFVYLYGNYVYVDSVLAADDYAKALAGNTNSTLYKQTLWDQTKGFTIPLFGDASHRLAELIYTAWAQAGKPLISPDGINDRPDVSTMSLRQNIPSPFSAGTSIGFFVNYPSNVLLQVLNASGQVVATLAEGNAEQGNHEVVWNAYGQPGGIYYIRLTTGKETAIKKTILIR